MKTLSLLFSLLIFLAGIGFSLLNTTTISVNYYFGNITMTSGLALVLSFVIGGVFGIIFGSLRRRR